MKSIKSYLALIVLSLIASCGKDEDIYLTLDAESIELEEQLIKLYGDLEVLQMPMPGDLANIPSDPNNTITESKVLLGKLLFHETGLAKNSVINTGMDTYSCAACHHADAGFQSGIKQGIGEGGTGYGSHGELRTVSPDYKISEIDVQPIRSPSILNTAYQDVMLWNGQFGGAKTNIGTENNWTEGTPKEVNSLGYEGLETQAIAGLEVHRLECDINLITELGLKDYFDEAFADIDESERYSKITAGLAIAAYERTVLANKSPFQKWLHGNKAALTKAEIKGAKLFFGKGNCYSCHNGPGLNSMSFHALGMNDLSGAGVFIKVDETTRKGRGGFTLDPNDDYKFKTPTLYNLKDIQFLGHGGSFNTVKEVIVYKNNGVIENADVPAKNISPLFTPLNLSGDEIDLLTLFVESSLHDDNLDRYAPTALPSGNCFPVADNQAKEDMGCGD